MIDRRALLAALAASACAPAPASRRALSVFAAGQPAAVLVQAVRPEALLGWPRRPEAAALAALRPELASLPELGALTASDAPASLEAVAARTPDMVIDYGDLGPALRDLAETTQARLGLRYEIINGALAQTPQALRRAGDLLDRADHAARLASLAEDILGRWRSAAAMAGPRFYYARGADGLETADAGALATQVLEGAGWINVVPAQPGKGLPRVSLEQVIAWVPEVVVTLDPAFARAARSDPRWSRARIIQLPHLPFGWLDRPPSINRLLGCAWTAMRDDRPALVEVVRQLHDLAYGRTLTGSQATALVADA